MTQTDKMLSRKEGGVGIVTFNNPERHNAVSLEMWEATKTILDGFAADKDIRVVVLTGAGGKAFVSGADISKFGSERATIEGVRAYNVKSDAAYASIADFPKPTIAMISGYCIGGGLGLATCCDLRICSDNSRFAVPAAKLGLGYGYTGLKRLVAQPMKLSRTPSRLAVRPPELGENTDAVLKEFGFSKRDIAALHKANAV
jgi:enoyl-CoA hydratase/carnithine racemase